MFEEQIKPSLVLTLICVISCVLLVVAYNATYVDNTGVVTEAMKAGLAEIYGTSDGYEMLKNDDGTVFAPEGVTSVLQNAEGNTAFEIIADGYASGGLHLLVCLDNNGAVSGISILAISETPGLGTKVQDRAFIGQFKGLTYDKLPPAESEESTGSKTYIWGSREVIDDLKAKADAVPAGDYFQLDAITGATFSSKGMDDAVTTALNAYNTMKGADVE